jgi:hypothetical protein
MVIVASVALSLTQTVQHGPMHYRIERGRLCLGKVRNYGDNDTDKPRY